jgi:adenosyl cobinamide kinase/adenosyl cobinamide phosphate guanylyltransferase
MSTLVNTVEATYSDDESRTAVQQHRARRVTLSRTLNNRSKAESLLTSQLKPQSLKLDDMVEMLAKTFTNEPINKATYKLCVT